MFPSKLKLADVSSIYKKGGRNDKSNYCTVGILSAISKVYEMQRRYQLKAEDYATNGILLWFLAQMRNLRFVANLVGGGEAGFAMNGGVSSQTGFFSKGAWMVLHIWKVLLNSFGDQFVNGHFQRLWWVQDGDAAHRTRMEMQLIAPGWRCSSSYWINKQRACWILSTSENYTGSWHN